MKKRIIYIILILFTQLVLTACGGGFFQDDVVTIEAIETKELQNGNIEITITYLDDLLEPVIFEIPKGKEGTGIKEVTTTFNEENNSNILTIFYTDNENTTTIEVLNGVGIKEIKSFTNEETNEEYLVIDYTNNTSSNPFLLPKGEKGDTGNGIASITTELQEDGSTKLVITYTDEEMEPLELTIPAPEKGDEGRGIDSIVSSEEDGKYILTITYTNPLDGEEPQVIELHKPKDPNAWISGSSEPKDTDGKEGDYYFDTSNKRIYYKEAGRWNITVDFNQANDFHKVSFNLNSTTVKNEWYFKDQKLDITYDINQVLTIGDNGNWFIGTKDTNIIATTELPENYITNNVNPTLEYPYVLHTVVEEANLLQGNQHYYMLRNTYFLGSGYIMPIPERPGYKFLGWYTEREQNYNSGVFTDLTVILTNLELYARWEKIA